MHLADAFIQSDLQCIQAIHFYQYVYIWFRELRIKNLNRELSVPLPYQIAKHPSVALTHSLIFHDFIVILLFYVQLFRDDQIQIRFIKNIILLKRLLLMIQLNWFAEQVLHFFVTEISLEIKPCDWWHVEVRSQNFISVILVSLTVSFFDILT